MRHLITIEGNIGSGKTTMLTKMQEWITKAQIDGVATVKEPVDLWQQHGLLEAMYNGQLSTAVFQQMALATRQHTVRDALRKIPPPGLVIAERSFVTDAHVFAALNIKNPHELKCYGVLQHLAVEDLIASCDGDVCMTMILLDATAEAAHERTQQRDRCAEEDALALDVFVGLQRAHDDLFELLNEPNGLEVIDPWRRIPVTTVKLPATTLEDLDAAFVAIQRLVQDALPAPEPADSPSSSMANLALA